MARSSWSTLDPELRPRSRASALLIFFFLLFLPIGFLLVMLGFDLDTVDRWLEGQSGWMDRVGSLMVNALGGIILLVSVVTLLGGLWQKVTGADKPAPGESDERIGWGCMVLTPIAAYFGWLLMTG